MDDEWQTFGHSRSKAILQKQLSGGRLAHAYLFSGPVGVGKFSLALEFAQNILGAKNLDAHPDFIRLDVSGEITVEPLRDFMSKLSLKPFSAKHKVAIINNADNMNKQSANALLKTLEEPSESTVLILIGDAQKLPATIRSRCQIFNMQLFNKHALQAFAEFKGWKVSSEMLDLSFGSPGRLSVFVSQPELFAQKQQQIEDWKRLRAAKPAEKFLFINKLAEMETFELRERALDWLFYEQGILGQHPESCGFVEALQTACLAFDSSQNKKSILQNLFLKI